MTTAAPRGAAVDPIAAQRSATGAMGPLGLESMILISPERAPVLPDAPVVAAAVRDEDDPQSPEDAASALRDALPDVALDRAGVVYAGCFAAARDPHGLACEIAATARIAGAAIIVEDDVATPSSPFTAEMRRSGLRVHEHRSVLADGAAVRRVTVAAERRRGTAPAPLRVAISDHQGKSERIAAALVAAGHIITPYPSEADAVLIDHDVPFHGKLPLAEACVASGGSAFIYPHGATASLLSGWDGIYPVSPLLAGQLVLAPGHALVADLFGYPRPVHVIGWTLCDLRPRQPRRDPGRILFAPVHPPWAAHSRNAEVFGQLLRMTGVEITVRHLGELADNELWPVEGVRFVRGDAPGAPGMIEQIDASDAVVSDQSTFANLAVARGVTTVMWDSAVMLDNDGVRAPDHVELYREIVRFPWETTDAGDDLAGLLHEASRDTELVGAWRERFIGAPLDPGALVAALRGV